MLESKDIEKPEPENKGFVLFLSHAEWPPQEAKRADSSITGTVPRVCPREPEVSLARTLLHRPTAVRVQDDFSRWSCCASFSDNDSGECSLILSEREGEIFDFDTFFLKCLEYV